jgi:tRNA A-37 threonylcarbamoyl transferase component Bud32
MSTQFEQIIESFLQGSSTLEATCQQLARESQADPTRTRFWGQRVETEMKRGRIAAVAARSMLDALEGFQSDKTMWLDPSMGLSRTGPVAAPPTTSPKTAPPRSLPSKIDSPEQLRATLFAPLTRPRATRTGPSVEPIAAPPAHSAGLDVVPLGTVIQDRYRLVAHLGAGGIGQIFDAIDLAQAAETHVTLKIVAVNLQHEPYALEALKTAVARSQHLDHPNIVQVYDIDQHEDRVFITMEPLRGRWLSGMVREVRNKGMSYEAAWPIIEGVANGLAFAHARGIVHSDLSPHAVFVCEDGTAKIIGFGLAHAVPASNESLDVLDTLTLRAYTEAYTADAWIQQGTPHPADDLYPLGVIAYEMLTGLHPFSRCSLSVARQKGLTCAPIEGLNRRAHKLIQRCLSFERDVRPKDGITFLKRMRPGLIERLRLATGAFA